MQPTPPSSPNRPPKAPPGPTGSGMIGGLIILLIFVYLMDHAGKGEVALFSGVDRHVSGINFHDAQCIAIFGGCKIDLRDAQIAGREAVLDTFAVFGGVEIQVPDDWEVVNHNVSIFGGVSEQRRQPLRGSATKTLILNGATIFGGTEVKN